MTCIFLLNEIKTSQLIMQTCSQENPRVKINWGMVFEALNKSKTCENKKGNKEIHSSQNWKNPNMEKYLAQSQYFCHNFLHSFSIYQILAAIERSLNDLKLFSLTPKKKKKNLTGY